MTVCENLFFGVLSILWVFFGFLVYIFGGDFYCFLDNFFLILWIILKVTKCYY